MSTDKIQQYYDALAHDYDANRFGNSYGRYVDGLERKTLNRWLRDQSIDNAIDIGCGTGRLLDFAQTGVDASAEMLKVAHGKFPNRRLIQDVLPELKRVNLAYRTATCFHVWMHMSPKTIHETMQRLTQVIEVGGSLIVDIPSLHRRNLTRRQPSATGWHGNTAASEHDIATWAGDRWRIVGCQGILFFPIHRLPAWIRPSLGCLDDWLGRTPLRKYSSYHIYRLERLT